MKDARPVQIYSKLADHLVPAYPLPAVPPTRPSGKGVRVHSDARRPQPDHVALAVKQKLVRLRLSQRLMRHAADDNIAIRLDRGIHRRPPRLLRTPRTQLPIPPH